MPRTLSLVDTRVLRPTESALSRILNTLEQELIEASTEEIMAAASELGMNPEMKGSAAFVCLTSPARPQLSDAIRAQGSAFKAA